MKWLYLAAGLLFETIGFISLKYSKGLTQTVPAIVTVAVDLAALFFFVLALRRFETSFVYMVAAGLGTALVVIANAVVFRQSLTWFQAGCVLLIIIGTVGLQSAGGAH